jgi:FAD/FMN-containing dehydrogenase
MSRIQQDVFDAFSTAIRGSILRPADAGYDEARAVWNAMIDRRPALIVRCTGVADVMRSIAFARDQALALAVRGGGHNIAGSAICDDGLVIDLSNMRSVRVDPQTRRAYVDPGARLADFDHEAQAFGLATPLGINSTTGVAGLTLGGGFGWLTRQFGLSIDNLISAEVISAEGKRLIASATENPDLFWALRGGGGNFGVVTQFEFQLHPVGPQILAGLLVFPFDQAKSILGQYRSFVAEMPENMNVWVVLRKAPPLPFLPETVHGKEVLVLAVFYVGDIEEGKRRVEPLRGFAKLHGEHVGAMPYVAWQQAFDPLLTPGARNYWKSHNFTQLADGAIDTTIKFAGKLPSPQCEIFIGLLGGRASRPATDAMAYAQRAAKFVMNVHARWETAQEDQACIGWSRDFFKAAAQYATGGVYVNFLTQDEADRIAAAYGQNFSRLAQLKKKFDPENVFRMNQNIAPAAR